MMATIIRQRAGNRWRIRWTMCMAKLLVGQVTWLSYIFGLSVVALPFWSNIRKCGKSILFFCAAAGMAAGP
jgi:hypothetical protein